MVLNRIVMMFCVVCLVVGGSFQSIVEYAALAEGTKTPELNWLEDRGFGAQVDNTDADCEPPDPVFFTANALSLRLTGNSLSLVLQPSHLLYRKASRASVTVRAPPVFFK